MTIEFANDNLALLLKLVLIKERVTNSVAHEVHSYRQIRCRGGEVILDNLLLRLAVVQDAELIDGLQIVFVV